jgi:cell wall-associated NlpC family hydrolase
MRPRTQREALRRHVLTVAAAGIAFLAVAQPAATAPPIPIKRAQAAQVLAELQVLDDRLEQSIEAYNLVRIRLASTARALESNSHHLRVARRNLASAQRRFADRLVSLYTSADTTSPLAVILGARSFRDAIDSLDTARRIADQDAVVLGQVRTFGSRVAREQRTLREGRHEQTQLAAKLTSQRAAIEAQLGERRRLLSSIKDEIAQLQAEERGRQQRLRQQAETRVAAARAASRTQSPPEPELDVAAVTPDGVSVAPDTRHAHVVAIAMQYLGVPYRWGGASPETGFDCSGFVMYVYAQVGISLPHNAAMQYGYGVPVAKEDLQPGDLVFFSDLGHDGIYLGGGQFIQAPRTGDVVKISSLSEPWYAAGYVGARRLP